jgi:choline kinase
MQNIKHAIISAAGLGSRLGLDIPKCLVGINGTSLIERQLSLLNEIEDVRVVIGFKETEVINHVVKIRRDVVFVRNPDYASTSNSHSLYLATKDLKDPFLTIDGDLIIEPNSFKSFVRACDKDTIIGVSRTASEDAVFVLTNNKGFITGFSRKIKTPFEWTGLAYLNGVQIDKTKNYQFESFEKLLPLRKMVIDCNEIDTPGDLEKVIQSYENISSDEYFINKIEIS